MMPNLTWLPFSYNTLRCSALVSLAAMKSMLDQGVHFVTLTAGLQLHQKVSMDGHRSHRRRTHIYCA